MTRTVLTSLVSGVVFGAGLILSGMTRPDKVIGFLDVFGAWDPSLAFVMGGAIAVHATAWWIASKWDRPLFVSQFSLPTRSDIDTRLVAGAAIFGLGWGLGGFCPGPALVSIPSLDARVLVFVAAMIGGMQAFRVWDARARPVT